jgi:hypothetical protein
MGSDLSNDFNRFGHPGKYWKVTAHTGGQQAFTASFYGAGAIYVSGSGFTANDYVKFSGGGTIPLISLGESTTDLHEFSISEVSSSAASDTVYVLHTNKPRGVL